MRHLVIGFWLAVAAPLSAQIPTPDRPVTNPRSLISRTHADAAPVPLEHLVLSRSIGTAVWAPDGRQVFLTTDLSGRMNIWRVDAAGSWPAQLTQSDDGQSGLVVSPDGRTLYFHQDHGGDELHDLYAVPTGGGPVVNLTETPDIREIRTLVAPDGQVAALSTKHRSQGQINLAVIELATRRVRPLVTEADPQYRWFAIAWVDGGRALIAERRHANATVAELYRIDVATGARRVVLAKPDTLFEGGGATRDGRLIAVSSNVGGGQMRAGVYDVETRRFRWAKPTPWEQQAVGIAPDDRTLLVRTIVDGRAELSLIDLATMAERPVPLSPGQNLPASRQPFSRDARQLLIEHSGADTPAEIYIVDVATGRSRPLTALAMASLAPAGLPKSEVVTYRSFDGTLVSAVVTMPFNLTRDGTNPAIVFPHGGPTDQAEDDFSSYATALASRGYMVIQPNFRGSTGYGTAFQTANRKDLGGGDLKDILAAKDFLVASGFVDPKRVGIFGGSYGGFMTLMALGKAPEAFAAGVQRFGIINWQTMYEKADPSIRAYVRSLLGDPVEDRAAYEAASPMTFVRSIKAPLLTLQGANDIRVPQAQAREVEAALKAQGGITETIVYPGEGHGFQKHENQLDALKRTVAWFEAHLKPRSAARR